MVQADDAVAAPAVLRGRSDGGFSFIEIVLAIALMGTLVVASLEAVSTSIKVSSTSRSSAQVETAIVNASDRINRAPKKCNYLSYAQAAVQTEEWDPSNASVVQEYYVPSGNPEIAGTWMVGPAGTPACPGVATDLLVQRVTITITSPDGKARRSITVVKSDV
jgi:type II secretory pathway pseudopilin PulG